MQKLKPSVNILLLAHIANGFIGVYNMADEWIDSYTLSDKIADSLPSVFDTIFEKYNVASVYYTRGPGSFTSIKLVHIFLQTIEITRNVKLFASDSFVLDPNPIKAHGNSVFVKKGYKITVEHIKDFTPHKISIPRSFDKKMFNQSSVPLYILPSVQDL